MANPEHLEILRQGVEAWNNWRKENPSILPDLREANLCKENLCAVNFSNADLSGADLSNADLGETFLYSVFDKYRKGRIGDNTGSDLIKFDRSGGFSKNGGLFRYVKISDLRNAKLIKTRFFSANLRMANLNGANLSKAVLIRSNLEKVDLKNGILHEARLNWANLAEANLEETILIKSRLRHTNFFRANLSKAQLQKANLNNSLLWSTKLDGANLTEADLFQATIVKSSLKGTNLTNCCVYGISAWDLKINKKTKQSGLVITDLRDPVITVDDLEVAQFVHLLINNDKIKNVIDTIGEKGVLILGRFTPERKAVLDAMRDKLRELGFVPMMFDFEKPTQRDFTETIKTLAGMSRFIIADITNPKSAPLELQATMPDYMIPFVPIIHEGEEPFSMFRDLKQKYGDWVLDILEYDSADSLVDVMDDAIVDPALEMADRLLLKKAEVLSNRHVREYRQT